ncbi:MAG: molybdopterin molybdotransferase MoeA [Spirochaetia bacterium]|nr:molybdopterin molybdotransferase MoeA [Spirochaetia bacterium]
MITVDKASKIIENHRINLKTKIVSIQNSLNYILAENIYADRDYPPFNRATMDGYALSFENFKKNENSLWNSIDTIFAGEQKNVLLKNNECIKIMTGAPIPDSANLVIKVEDSVYKNNSIFFKNPSVKKWMNISRKGEDIKKNNQLLEKGTRIDHIAISILATIGKTNIKVYEPPKAAIISTGSEIIDPFQTPKPFQIRDSNSYSLKAFLNEYLIKPEFMIKVSDNKKEIKKNIKKGLKYDLLFISGGVSMGDKDFVPEILESLEVKKIFHKVKIKPGKPVWFGKYADKTLVFGMPGNPFSCQVIYKVLIEPLIRTSFSMPKQKPIKIPIAFSRRKKNNRDEFFPVKFSSSKFIKLLPVINMGSGDIKAAKDSIGLAIQKAEKVELKENECVDFIFWRTL